MRTWCGGCKKKPGACGRCRDRIEHFDTIEQCADYILSRAFVCDEAIVAETMPKLRYPAGGFIKDVIAWATEVGR